ncbi:hypothetical protein GCM10027168_13750 [Streptomyces capparidis]
MVEQSGHGPRVTSASWVAGPRSWVAVGQGCFTDRAVDVSDGTARSAHDVVVIVPDTPLEPGRTAG